jgi:hypothetical protein
MARLTREQERSRNLRRHMERGGGVSLTFMYAVAEDWEAETIRDVARRAGLIVTCAKCGWDEFPDTPCSSCAMDQQQADELAQ